MSLRVYVRNRMVRTRRRSIYVIPFLLTFGNALCGFLSIIASIEGDVLGAAYYILLAALFDMLDGRVARAFGASSSLGMELDSLCDAISFCLAPLVAVYCWQSGVQAPFFMPVLAFYLCAGLFRLAKFNVLSFQKRTYFLGLPTTLSALLIAQFIIYEHTIMTYVEHYTCIDILIGTLAATSLLMVSAVHFPSGKYVTISASLKGWFVFLGMCMLAGLVCDVPVTLAVLLMYVCASVVMHIVRTVRLS